MKKYKILLNMINNFTAFFLGYYMHFRALLSLIPLKLKEIRTISNMRQQNIFLNFFLKKGSNENLYDFLRIL